MTTYKKIVTWGSCVDSDTGKAVKDDQLLAWMFFIMIPVIGQIIFLWCLLSALSARKIQWVKE